MKALQARVLRQTVSIRTSHLALTVAASVFAAPSAIAQSYPTKPIQVISSASPGSSGDAGLRLLAAKMSESMGQPVIIELRTAARGAQAYAVMGKAAPDGHTIQFGTAGTFVYGRFLFKNMAFDILKDYSPISMSFNSPAFVALPKSMGITTYQAFVDYAKKNPGKIEYGSTGSGSFFHLATEGIKVAAGIDLLHIPYAQANFPQLQIDWASGRIPLWLTTWSSFRPQIDKFNILATVDRVRDKRNLPNVPTMLEVQPNYEPIVVWWGFFGPVGLPATIANRIAAESRKAMSAPDVVPRLDEHGLNPIGSTPDELARLLRADINAVEKVVKEIGLKPE